MIAGFAMTANGRGVSLLHGGFSYTRNRKAYGSTYWRCTSYIRNGCKARAITRTINGFEMMKVSGDHTHPVKVIT